MANWQITVVVDFETGNHVKAGDKINYRVGGNEHTGEVDSFISSTNKDDGPLIKVKRDVYIGEQFDTIFCNNIQF